jgi:hypothetical protein
VTDFESRQLLSMTQRRSSFSHEPPGFNRASRRLDQIEQAQAEALHVERIRQSFEINSNNQTEIKDGSGRP